jgi:hypothetical protein
MKFVKALKIFNYGRSSLPSTALVVMLSAWSLQQAVWAEPGEAPPSTDRRQLTSVWSVMHEVHRRCSSSRLEFLALLSHASVREEVGIDSEEYQHLKNSTLQLFESIKALQRAHSENPLTEEQLINRLSELVNQHDLAFNRYLEEASNYDRFIGLFIQARGNRAVCHLDVARRLDVPPEKLEELRMISHDTWRAEMDRMGERFKDLLRRGKIREIIEKSQNAEMREVFIRAESRVNEAIGRRMTAQQLKALQQLRGPEFDIPKDFFELRYSDGSKGRSGS